MNWLLTWLGQTQSLLEVDAEESAKTPEPPASSQQAQWLTLLPSVPASQNLLAPVAPDEVALEPPPLEEVEEETKSAADGVQPVVAAPVAPPIPPVLAPLEPETAVKSGPAPRQKVEIRQRTDTPVRVPAAQPDKGELIWAAEFVVAEKAPEPIRIEETELSAETAPVARLEKAAITGAETPPDSRRQSPEEQSPERRRGGSQSRRTASDSPIERSAPAKPLEPAQREAPPLTGGKSTGGKFEVPVLAAVAQGNAKAEFRSPPATAETIISPAVGSVELDTARPLRPAQIATLYVDVPAPPGAEDAPTIRLAVSQRGDQVTVRLRSWDAGAAPLENDRMQPLLQLLAEQGYAAAKKSIERLDERGRLAMEQLREKPLAAAETAGSDNGQQQFQNADGRQRRNQERQQQAFLLRRQMQPLNTEQFDLQAHLEGGGSSQQGAF